jgi:hypothetical protein
MRRSMCVCVCVCVCVCRHLVPLRTPTKLAYEEEDGCVCVCVCVCVYRGGVVLYHHEPLYTTYIII